MAAKYIYELLDSSGVAEIGAIDEISLNEIAKNLNKKVKFSGNVEFQNTVSPNPSYPSSFEVISYLKSIDSK